MARSQEMVGDFPVGAAPICGQNRTKTEIETSGDSQERLASINKSAKSRGRPKTGFDKKAYMKEYMRKRRASKAKALEQYLKGKTDEHKGN